MKVTFWGVRGSIPAPGERTCRVGGNTSCVQVDCADETLILDAGTGIRELGLAMDSDPEPRRIHLFITHTHWDHIQGLPFFKALYKRENEVVVYGPRGLERGLEDAIMIQMQRLWFPVRRGELSARISFTELGEETFNIGPVVVSTKLMNHPVLSLSYSLMHDNRRVVYTGDNEPFTFCHVYNPST
jgi:phosphoribosyl 1,2-cyclic phosphodiesterase